MDPATLEAFARNNVMPTNFTCDAIAIAFKRLAYKMCKTHDNAQDPRSFAKISDSK
jgi:hypothetical protein